MSRYRKIDTRIWTDEKFRQLSHDGKYFFVYLLTSPHSTAWGAYVLDDLYVQADLGFSPQKIKQLWKELANCSLTLRDEKTRLVCFPNWFKYNIPSNEKTSIACIRGILSLPKSPVLLRYCEKSDWVREKLANLNLTISEQLDDEQGALSKEQEQGTGALSKEQATDPPKAKHLRYVFLLEKEFQSMKEKLGERLTSDLIERLDGYIAQIGVQAAAKKYVSHYDTMLNWHRKDEKQGGFNGTGNNSRAGAGQPGGQAQDHERKYPIDVCD